MMVRKEKEEGNAKARLGICEAGVWDKYGECVREVKKDSVKEAIEKVMRKGGDHEKRREKAKKYADMAKKTIEEGGSSYHNMSMLIDDIVHAQSLNQS